MKEPQPEHAACLDVIAGLLIRCFLGGILLLTVWFLCFVFAGDWIYQLHSRWFAISRQELNAIHYSLMAVTKITLVLFFLLPYIAIRLVAKKRENKKE
jgi:heme/copper-type cytochrome/quinol oxidase subunit 2